MQRNLLVPFTRTRFLQQSKILVPRAISRFHYSTTNDVDYKSSLSEQELDIYNKLSTQLDPVQLKVKDISGGCGSMFAIHISSNQFNNLSIIKQHQLVNSILKDDIKNWHGLQLTTKKTTSI
ncbi:hypothetical protein TBLA_0A04430 [Henningerozyma blattae CBS 6284]|uniref:Uncharacterized protein n=1 Tax=Henningerozyma blattae (strain ATCC 34711 / CBS 6284 / DSM 70876 / NBRC 10599 / NRRL Y-10934 / UCD 77-7) TaxID=1071380 RepID=I2GVT5_HENB6|nr:hypothetical protein TBLA_0A04430 [Tetrapisispora blattae CBS 6284]CCH58237.1 hypothetical protein TBLA_0A04430 [Tetrapisispora blattae CBS 6284]